MKIKVNNNFKNKIMFKNNYQNILDLNEFKNTKDENNNKNKKLNYMHTKYLNKRQRNNDNISSIFEKEKQLKSKNKNISNNKMDIEEFNNNNNFISKEIFNNINNFESEKKKNIEQQKFLILNKNYNKKKFDFKKIK